MERKELKQCSPFFGKSGKTRPRKRIKYFKSYFFIPYREISA
jgi:hypothetical protein